MSKAVPETSQDATVDAPSVASPTNPKKIAVILAAAVVVGLLVGVGGAMALKKANPSAPATAPATTDVPTETGAVKAPDGSDKPTPLTVPTLEPAPAPTPAPAPAPASGAVPMPIPVLTGAEIKERYNISRFVDRETDRLCYLAEPRASGMNGSLSCEQRPSHVPNLRGK